MKKTRFSTFYNFFLFFTGSPSDNPGKRILRYTVYIVIVLTANVLLGKNIGNTRYPWYANISVFLLLNINIVLTLLLFILIFRNIAKLMSDRKRRIFGSKLQTKLLIFCVVIVIFPAFSTYFISSRLINSSINRWFDNNVYRTMRKAADLSEDMISYEKERLMAQSEKSSLFFEELDNETAFEKLKEYNSLFVANGFIESAFLIFPEGLTYFSGGDAGTLWMPDDKVKEAVFAGKTVSGEYESKEPYFWAGAPVYSQGKIYGAVFLIKKGSVNVLNDEKDIEGLYELFKQLQFYSYPVKKAFNVTLVMIAMLIIFASIWGSMIFVRSIAVPLKSLATAAGNISRGKFNTKVDAMGHDEISFLSKSFNYMAYKLDEHTKELENKNIELNRALDIISTDKMYIDMIYKNVASGIVLFDRNLKVLKVNEVADGLIFQDGSSIGERIYEALSNFISSNNVENIIQLEIETGGEKKVFTAHINKVLDSLGNPDNILLVLDDNSLIMNLQRINLWKEVATRIAHEIKNPLTPIKLTAERVKRRSIEIPVPQVRELVDKSMVTIVNEVEELLNLVEDFNVYARLPSVNKEEVDLSFIVDGVVELQRKASSADMVLNMPKMLVKGDRYQLKRVFTNLVQNAIHAVYGVEGARIEVSGEESDGYAVVSISDNGCGIKDEDLSSIFVPYFSKKPDGTGLGLAIVKKIVEEHAGRIDVQSNAGVFTRFTVRLPLIDKG